MGWFNKSIDCVGGVFFRGSAPPRPNEFAFLKKHGMQVGLVKGSTNTDWTIRAKHPQWGEAEIQPETAPLSDIMIDHDWSLNDAEKEEARAAGASVSVRIKANRKNLLADRKNLLRFLHAIMGDDGVIALDLMAYRLWSRDSLKDEVAHDADLDITQIYVIHCVQEADDTPCKWAHTHGLGEIGFFDFDILFPHPTALSNGGDMIRSIASAITEEAVHINTPSISLFQPGGDIAFCPVDRFHKSVSPEVSAARDNDEFHSQNRAVICEPARGFWGRFRKKPRISKYFSNPLPPNSISALSKAATELMAQRARNTYSVFRHVSEELRELQLPTIVKLGYPVDNGEPDEREHLWFQVHGTSEKTIDATLANTPYNVSGMKEGDRGEHPVELITDWMVMSPLGNINPRQQHVFRVLRENKAEIKAMLEAHGGPAAN